MLIDGDLPPPPPAGDPGGAPSRDARSDPGAAPNPHKRPWEIIDGGKRIGTRSTRKAAMNFVDKRRWVYGPLVLNQRTGEVWQRRGGSWFKIREARKRKKKARP